MTKELTLTEFRTIIREEAMKLKRRLVLENEKKQLQKELDELLNESCVDEGLRDTGFGKMLGMKSSDEKLEDKKEKMKQKFVDFENKFKLKKSSESHLSELMKQAEADNFRGTITYSLKTKELMYRTSTEKDSGPGMNTKGGGSMYENSNKK